MAAPVLMLLLTLEGRPAVHLVADHDEDQASLRDWLSAHPRWQQALAELLDAEQAA